MRRRYEFVQLDVFTRTRLMGNPLAVVTDARGLTDDEMQKLAREMNLSETTFIVPRAPEVEAREGHCVRIFTIEEELPFAGHPTLGTALYLHSTLARQADHVVLHLNIGKVPVRFAPDSQSAIIDQIDGKIFGEMRQPDPEFGPTLPPHDIARVLGMDSGEIASEWPSQVISTGLPFAIMPFRNLETLANLKPDVTRMAALPENTGARFFYFIYFAGCQKTAEARARLFFYGGEDPATGSAAGCVAAWMAKYGIVN